VTRTISPCLTCLSLLLTAAAGLGLGAYHRTPLTEPSDTNGLPPALALSNAPLRRLSKDVFALGLVRLDKSKRAVIFPASVNMADGVVEYALVHRTGKVHESVLKTEADPLHIHLATLLLSPPQSAAPAANPRTPSDLLGPHLTIWAQWKVGGSEKHVRLEDLVSNTLTKSQMSRGDWIYNGSRVVQGVYLAQRDGSIVAIIADPDAMINSPRAGRDDDEIWRANRSLVPPVGTAVEVTLQLGGDS
jgi:hypothetical protein